MLDPHTDIEKRMPELDPVSTDEIDIDAAWEHFVEYRESACAEPNQGLRVSGARWALAGTAVAALVAGIFAVFALRSDGGPIESLSLAAEVAAAAESFDTELGAEGHYATRWRTSAGLETAVAGGVAWSIRQPAVVRADVEPDGSGSITTRSAPQEFVGDRDRERAAEAGLISTLEGASRSTTRFGPGELGVGGDRSQLDVLPDDPDAVADALTAGAAASSGDAPVEARMLELGAMYLFEPSLKPEIRAAVFNALATQDGIEAMGMAVDPQGRRGQAVGVESDFSGTAIRYKIIFDQESAQILSYEEIALEPVAYADAEAPFTVYDRIFLRSRTVNDR